jgi:hypothetical protein
MRELSNFMFMLIVLVTLYVFVESFSASAIDGASDIRQDSPFNSDHNIIAYNNELEADGSIGSELSTKTAFISLAPQKLLVILIGLLMVIGLAYLLTGRSNKL